MHGQLEAYFDAAFTAPDGVKRLRELILTLAVQGKLTDQRESDEPASDLLKKIAAEKKKLEKEGKIKKQKALPPVADNEKPYALPKGWEWVRLGDVVLSHGSGWSPQCLSRQRAGEEWGVLKVSAVSWGIFNPNENKALPPGATPKRECAVCKGDLLISRANTDELVARSVLVTTCPENLLLSDKIVRISLSKFTNDIFINTANLSTFSRSYYVRNASGTSSSMKNISRETILHLPIPLPPLAEQQRIVECINTLMARCDALEAMHKEQEHKRNSARAAAMHALTMPQGTTNPALAFSRNWGFLARHFEQLFTTKQDVAELRKAILQLAVMGKLTDQRDSDEPASELLKKIAAEKRTLEIEGKIKKQKPLPPVNEDEKPYTLPKGWEWVRLGEIASIERGGSPRPIQAYLTDRADGLNWIKIGDTEKGGKFITTTREKIIPNGLSKTRMVYPGDFLLTNSMSFGRPYITLIEGCIHDGWLRISPPSTLNKDYLYSLLSSQYINTKFTDSAAGAVVLNLNSDKVRELIIPLPSLAEQQRIVERVNSLMALCDTLEERMESRTQTQSRLLDAVVATA